MTTARDHIRTAARHLSEEASSTQTDRQLAMSHALLAIACTLADMADMDADTRTQPTVKPPTPAPNYQLYHPGDTERIPT